MAKIDKVRLLQLRKQGKSQSYCAKEFQCSESAIALAERKMREKVNTIPDVSRSELSRDNIDVLIQQKTLNGMLLDQLKRCERLIMHEEKKTRVRDKLEVSAAREPGNEHITTMLKVTAAPKLADTLSIQKNLLLNAVEMRKQGEFQFKIAEALHNVMMVAEFQETILNVLKEITPDLRDRVIKRMKELRQIRGLIKMQ